MLSPNFIKTRVARNFSTIFCGNILKICSITFTVTGFPLKRRVKFVIIKKNLQFQKIYNSISETNLPENKADFALE